MNNATLIFDGAGEQKSFKVKSNSQWSIECGAEWVTFSTREGSGDSSVNISANATNISRSAVVIVYVLSAQQIRQTFNIVQHAVPKDEPQDSPNDNTEGTPDDNPDEEPEDNTDDQPEDNPNDQPEDKPEDNPNDNPDEGTDEGTDEGMDDDSQEQPEDNTDNNQPEDNPNDNTDEPPATTPDESKTEYIEITTLSQLSAGDYYIGGYQNDVLYLATEGISSGHIHTTPYIYSSESLSLTPQSDEQAIVVRLEPTSDENCYYLSFSDEGYLDATDAKAGKLTFTPSREKAWRFSEQDYGFLVVQQGDIGVKLICSEHAPDRLLRSISSEIEEEGGAIVLFIKR